MMVVKARAALSRLTGRGGVMRVTGPSGDSYGTVYGSGPRSLRESLMWNEVGVNITLARETGSTGERIHRQVFGAC